MLYEAINYAMGRATKTVRFDAPGDDAAREIAIKRVPGNNIMVAKGRGFAIGIKKVKA